MLTKIQLLFHQFITFSPGSKRFEAQVRVILTNSEMPLKTIPDLLQMHCGKCDLTSTSAGETKAHF